MAGGSSIGGIAGAVAPALSGGARGGTSHAEQLGHARGGTSHAEQLSQARVGAHGKAQKGHSKHHRRRRHRRRKHPVTYTFHPTVIGLLGAPAPPAIPASAPAPSNAPAPAQGGPISLAQARRMLWRAGFGPRPGEAEALAGAPLEEVVYGLTRPSGPAVLSGPQPTDDEGNALEPADAWGEDHCWWLDRMIRSNQQLVERMTFIWHDWFANSNEKVNNQQMMLDQNNLFRENALGNFHSLFLALTTNPAMLVFLDGIYNDKHEPNENYAREMMELFSLGADRGAYTEDDVREMARALTGLAPPTGAKAAAFTTSASNARATTNATRKSSARPATGTGKTPCGCASRTRCTRRSS